MVNILDCTLRDGGYYNDWDFSEDLVSSYVAAMNTLPVTHIELGFRFSRNANHQGAWAYTPTELVRRLKTTPKAKIGVMINASEFSRETAKLELDRLFPEHDPVEFVRIASHMEEAEKSVWLCALLKAKGYEVGINLMQVSEASESQIDSFLNLVKTSKADFVYFADSLGALNPEEAKRLATKFSSELRIPVGIHAHDNLGNALANSVTALDAGVTMVDATVLGMGRGAGNTSTENLTVEVGGLGKLGGAYDGLSALNEFIVTFIEPLRRKYSWGPTLPYRLAARWRIHPTYVQNLLEEGVNGQEIINTLTSLRSLEARRYDVALLARAQPDTELAAGVDTEPEPRLTPELMSRLMRPVLIVGSGPRGEQHSAQLQHLAESQDWTILALNLSWSECMSTNLFRVGSDTVRQATSNEVFWSAPGQKLLSRRGNSDQETYSIIPILSNNSSFSASADGVKVPDSSVLSFALASALFLQAPKILLGGVDGYKSGDSRNVEISASLRNFEDGQHRTPIFSLTQTIFPVQTISPYWHGIKN